MRSSTTGNQHTTFPTAMAFKHGSIRQYTLSDLGHTPESTLLLSYAAE